MKTGTAVRVIQPPPIEGVVKERRITPADELELLVAWTEGGSPVERWYPADQLQTVEAAQ